MERLGGELVSADSEERETCALWRRGNDFLRRLDRCST